MDHLRRAREFRERAQEFRKLALGIAQGQGREALLVMADEYENLAARIEKNAQFRAMKDGEV